MLLLLTSPESILSSRLLPEPLPFCLLLGEAPLLLELDSVPLDEQPTTASPFLPACRSPFRDELLICSGLLADSEQLCPNMLPRLSRGARCACMPGQCCTNIAGGAVEVKYARSRTTVGACPVQKCVLAVQSGEPIGDEPCQIWHACWWYEPLLRQLEVNAAAVAFH